jgi:hypothetical protein
MQVQTASLLTILVQGMSFIAAIAAIVASVIMYEVVKKFGKGILAEGFRYIMAGILFIAFAIVVDALQTYLGFANQNIYSQLTFVIKGISFVIGTYTIVIGSKRTVEKLEALTK